MTMIWTAGELKYDGENERGRGGELKQLKLFQNHSLQDFRYWILIAICVKLHTTTRPQDTSSYDQSQQIQNIRKTGRARLKLQPFPQPPQTFNNPKICAHIQCEPSQNIHLMPPTPFPISSTEVMCGPRPLFCSTPKQACLSPSLSAHRSSFSAFFLIFLLPRLLFLLSS